MALRLPPQPAAPAESLAARLTPRADALLEDHDLAGWVALFRSIDVEPDVHRRYEARRTLGERALAHAGGSPAQIAERMLVVAGRLLHVLDEEPREPVLLNQAGVAFYELGDLDAAEALFHAARRLDPALAQVDGNLAEVRRRRDGGITHQNGLPAEVREGLRMLGPRVRDVVGRARPAEGLTVALCMIVKDEEAMLDRSLAAVAPWVDDLIVVDTGSTDRTVEIARSHGARILHHEWQNDFAAARNVSFDAATTDWVLFLDADEVLVEGDGPRLRELLGHTWREAHFLVETNYTGTLESGTATTHHAMRLLRHRPERRFVGRLHEQIQHVPAYLPERLAVSTVRIEHFGYLGEVRERKDKVQRNRALLERQVADGEDSPFLRFNLGMEHVAAGDVIAALEHLELSWERLSDDPDRASYGFVPMLASHLVDALRVAERHDDALDRAAEALALFPGLTDIVLMQGHVHRAAGDPVAAEERYRHALALGDAPSAYVATVGAGTYLAGCALAALLVEQDRADEAESVLESTLRSHPGHPQTGEALASVLLRHGVPGAEVVARIHALVPELPAGTRQLVAAALHRAGAVDEAEAELRAVLSARPESDAARLGLVETLVLQNRLEEAATEALLVAAGGPHEEAALRHAAFCLLATDRPADDVLARAAAVLPADDHALFAAWAGHDRTLSSAVAELALTLLNALARLERFDAFERLVAVYERTDLPWRQRRERLARLYLRRGFLRSAAEEWMAVVDRDGPDVDAFRGLAIVATELGLHDDAAVFAADADALEDGPVPAGAVAVGAPSVAPAPGTTTSAARAPRRDAAGRGLDRHPPGTPPELTIVIPTLDAAGDRLRRCVRAIQDRTPVPYEIVVVDNGAPPQGFTAPVNAGLRAARGRYAVVCNDDVEVLDGWWPPLRDALDRGHPVAFPWTVDGAMREDFAAWCFALSRAALDEHAVAPGEFLDPHLVVWYQDTDLLERLRAAGTPPVLVRDAHVRHGLSETVATADPALRTWIDAQVEKDRVAFGARHGAGTPGASVAG